MLIFERQCACPVLCLHALTVSGPNDHSTSTTPVTTPSTRVSKAHISALWLHLCNHSVKCTLLSHHAPRVNGASPSCRSTCTAYMHRPAPILTDLRTCAITEEAWGRTVEGTTHETSDTLLQMSSSTVPDDIDATGITATPWAPSIVDGGRLL